MYTVRSEAESFSLSAL